MREATVVAFYGDKSPVLASMILRIQDVATHEFGHLFTPRPLEEVHATLIGLGESENLPKVRVSALAQYLVALFSKSPLTVQFGGFEDCSYPFRSRGRSLHERSVVINENQLVIIGWPVVETPEGLMPSDEVDRIRRSCADYGFAHKYHDSPGAFDPDVYMVLGDLSADIDSARFRDQAAERLGKAESTLVAMTDRDLVAVFYTDRRLPLSSSSAVAMSAVVSQS